MASLVIGNVGAVKGVHRPLTYTSISQCSRSALAGLHLAAAKAVPLKLRAALSLALAIG